MSSRNMRKMVEKLRVTTIDDSNEQEGTVTAVFEPLYAGNTKSVYQGLVVSSSSSDEEESNKNNKSTSASSDDGGVVMVTKKQKKNKNNRKNKNKNKRSVIEEEEDDIDKVVAEVNDLLGEAPVAVAEPLPKKNCSLELLKIDHKYLNVHNEVFGPKDEESRKKRKRRNPRLVRRQIIMTDDVYNFSVRGLSMSLVEIKNGVKYFKFEHGPEYQKNMHTLIKAMKLHYNNYIRDQEIEIFPTTTVEALIKNLDLYFHLEEAGLGGTSLEEAISFMQGVFDPAFNYLDGKTRLEYKYVENRVFHIALLKYLHILTNKACHRTALELAKLMLNLDPSDPLGVIFIVDTLALRAREHQWLVDIYNHWADEKDAARLFHLRYSHALAMYHLYMKTKNPNTLIDANLLIKTALVKYPTVSLMIMKLTRNENEEIMNHEIFTSRVNKTTSSDLLSLQFLYAKFVFPKWREQNIMDWVIYNALDILTRFKNDRNVEASVKQAAVERSRLFRKHPLEIKRHLSVISSMSTLLVDGTVPVVEKTPPFNPYPNQGRCIDVHRYYKNWGNKSQEEESSSSDEDDNNRRGLLRTFISSLVPGENDA